MTFAEMHSCIRRDPTLTRREQMIFLLERLINKFFIKYSQDQYLVAQVCTETGYNLGSHTYTIGNVPRC